MAGTRYANVLQRLIVELSEQISLNIVGLKCLGILSQTNRFEPFANFAHAASCSNRAFASFRSRVSKPSVNHP